MGVPRKMLAGRCWGRVFGFSKLAGGRLSLLITPTPRKFRKTKHPTPDSLTLAETHFAGFASLCMNPT